MKRALSLAAKGLGRVSPNPMVGAVIVAPDGRIIGEGFHRQYGGPHAEVNAVHSIKSEDKQFIPESTVYVTLEPCAHYGKTPPCAKLLIESGFRKVVIAAVDPFGRVNGKGVEMLKEAGIDVSCGLMAAESESLNARFFTAHRLRRPFVTLKWAMSADGYMDRKREAGEGAMRFSSALGTTLVHRLRANHDAIGVGSGTMLADRPRLDVRYWTGKNPLKVVFDRSGRVLPTPTGDIDEVLKSLYVEGVTSVLIEGGATLLTAFIERGLWDLARVETAPFRLLANGAPKAPSVPSCPLTVREIGENTIFYYSNNPLANAYFIENGL